jgi:hypothetical protein
MKSFLGILLIALLTSCSVIVGDKHFDEKLYTSGDIKVRWYRISEITTIHDFIHIERWGWTKTIMKANTGGIHDILIKGDTITIQAMPDLLVYDLTSKTLNCNIRLDTTITMCEYMKKHIPENAKYHCADTPADSRTMWPCCRKYINVVCYTIL